ncbi:hypothetical protein [Carnobacterium sp. TMP28]|uniref:hypothetical protein n=1 Tax=Carnobacterium sp. TMP28 TaxID=3397060 RepID=UPI0039DF3ABA
MKNKYIFAIAVITLFILSGCSNKKIDPNLFIYQNGGDVDTSVPLAYGIFSESDQLKVVWAEESNSYDTKLLTFKSDDEFIKISYQDKKEKKHTQTFEILSDSIVRDEAGIEYQWFGEPIK